MKLVVYILLDSQALHDPLINVLAQSQRKERVCTCSDLARWLLPASYWRPMLSHAIIAVRADDWTTEPR